MGRKRAVDVQLPVMMLCGGLSGWARVTFWSSP